MARRKWTPEERAAWEAERAEDARVREEFAEVLSRFEAYLRERRERDARRRAFLRRLIPFGSAI